MGDPSGDQLSTYTIYIIFSYCTFTKGIRSIYRYLVKIWIIQKSESNLQCGLMSIQTEFDSWTKKENEMTHLSTVRHLPVWIKVLALAPLLPNIGLFVVQCSSWHRTICAREEFYKIRNIIFKLELIMFILNMIDFVSFIA